MKEQASFSVYYASAGSGKTYSLAREYLKKILCQSRHDAYRNILALTFTNKAVEEMKSRIIDYLAAFARQDTSPNVQALLQQIADDTGWSPAKLVEKAQLVLRHLIHNYAAFDVMTLDKFTHKIIRTFAHDLKLSSSFDVSLDTDLLLEEAVDNLIAQAGTDEALTKLLLEFALEQTNDDKTWDIGYNLNQTGKLLFDENHRDEIRSLPDQSLETLYGWRKNIRDLLKALQSQQEAAVDGVFQFMVENAIPTEAFSRQTFITHLNNIKQGKLVPEKIVRSPEEIKVLKNFNWVSEWLPVLFHQLEALYEVERKRWLYDIILKTATPVSLLHRIQQEIQTIQQDRNLLSISEFNELIAQQIQNQPAPFIFERLGNRYHHFFVDEFQDTSVVQWKNLIPLMSHALASENEFGEKGTLMVVGDPKQSIYRWRGGRAEQLIDLANGSIPFKNPSFETVLLDTNYRSFSEVIEFNNAFFQFIGQLFDNENYQKLYTQQSHQKTTAKQGGYVELSFIPEKKEVGLKNEVNTEFVNQTLSILHRVRAQGFSWGEMALLVRRNVEGALLAEALIEAEIPVITPDSLLLQESEEVQFLLHVLLYLDQPSREEAKARFLHYLGQRFLQLDDPHIFVSEGLQCRTALSFDLWLQSNDLTLQFSELRQLSLVETVAKLVRHAILPERKNAYVVFFQDLVLDVEVRRQYRLREFLTYWDHRKHKLCIATPDHRDAVRIMTIHSSKGLEFPVVIYPFANINYSLTKRDYFWVDTADDAVSWQKVLVQKSALVAELNEQSKEACELKEQENLLDQINLLYVVQTRAIEQLYVVSQKISTSKTTGEYPNCTAKYYLSFLDHISKDTGANSVFSFGEAVRVSKQKSLNQVVDWLSIPQAVLADASLRIAEKAGTLWQTTANESREFGIMLHALLANIEFAHEANERLLQAQEQGLVVAESVEQVRQYIEQIMNHPLLVDFFGINGKHYREQPIFREDGQVFVPDRVSLFADGTAHILDYKTGQRKTEHEQQLKTYAELIEGLGYRVTKITLVYIGNELNVILL
ncbi:MAG: ATP-dependent helicase [Flavobacterium sp. BFFFF2]|nr:MAG: ATP-dependent helicase [Flavobacterium sp. BFFFF2]